MCNDEGVGLAMKTSQVRLSLISLSRNDSQQVVHIPTLSPSNIIWYWPHEMMKVMAA